MSLTNLIELKKEDIRSRLDIVQVVGRYVRLRSAGNRMIGLCPFHKEKTPSFTVSPDKNVFYCFGCGKGGDVFTFLMEYEGLGFGEVLKLTAEETGVRLPSAASSSVSQRPAGVSKTDLLDIHEWATRYYYDQMLHSETAKEYYRLRGLTGETVRDLKLGYAPTGWTNLVDYAAGKGISREALVECGLAIRRDSGSYYDRFRDRVMFPIFDITGRHIAFGGRSMQADGTPKYLNSPETALYRKNRVLYGLHVARTHIKNDSFVFFVEGYMDFLSLYQAGVRNCVATSGTALTEEHGKLIRRFTTRIVLVFDSDQAGLSAAERATFVLAPLGLTIQVLLLPEGDDPDTYVRRHGGEAFVELVRSAQDAVDFVVDRKVAVHGDETPQGKSAVVQDVIPLLRALEDQVVVMEYVKRIAKRLQIEEGLVLAQMRSGLHSHQFPPGEEKSQSEKYIETEEGSFIHILVRHPDLRETIADKVTPKMLTDQFSRELYSLIMDGLDGTMEPECIVGRVVDPKVREVLALMLIEVPHTANAKEDILHKGRQLVHKHLQERRRETALRLKQALDQETKTCLLREVNEITGRLGALRVQW